MIPDIEVQLQVIIKSLKDNVVPAIDSENQLAQQQIQLSLAALEITLGHLPMAHSVMRKDLSAHINVAEKLSEVCIDEPSLKGLAAAIQLAEHALSDPSNGFVQLQQQARLLRNTIGAAISSNAETEQAQAVERVVLETSDATLMLGRAWNKPMGFEPDPNAVEELSSQLGFGN